MPISFDLALPDDSLLKRAATLSTNVTQRPPPVSTPVAVGGLTFSLKAAPSLAPPSLAPPPAPPLRMPTEGPVGIGVVRNRLRLPTDVTHPRLPAMSKLSIPTLMNVIQSPTAEQLDMAPSTSSNRGGGDKKCTSRADDPENDQYDVGDQNLCIAVLCRNDNKRKNKNSLLGQFGHVERLSSWVHLIGGVLFAVYASARHLWGGHSLAQYLTTGAAAALSFCFLASAVYHISGPSKRLTYFTRQLDYAGIYLAVSAACVADLCIATRGFAATTYLSILDVPLAAVITFAFFIVRRAMLPAEESWSTYLGSCTLTFGLMRRGHVDTAHTATRQATSLLLTIGYFSAQAASFETFGIQTAVILLSVEIVGLFFVVAGMSLDNVWLWPDSFLAKGKGPRFLACTSCGCIASGHALWHIISLLVAVKGVVAREYALSLLR